jgi:hypothetical protein
MHKMNWAIGEARKFKEAYLLGSNGLLAGLVKLLDSLRIIAKIFLATDENNRKTLAEVEDFRNPLEVGTCQQSLFMQAATPGTIKSALPSPERCRANPVSQQQNR